MPRVGGARRGHWPLAGSARDPGGGRSWAAPGPRAWWWPTASTDTGTQQYGTWYYWCGGGQVVCGCIWMLVVGVVGLLKGRFSRRVFFLLFSLKCTCHWLAIKFAQFRLLNSMRPSSSSRPPPSSLRSRRRSRPRPPFLAIYQRQVGGHLRVLSLQVLVPAGHLPQALFDLVGL